MIHLGLLVFEATHTMGVADGSQYKSKEIKHLKVPTYDEPYISRHADVDHLFTHRCRILRVG